jgi:hypothetical protein
MGGVFNTVNLHLYHYAGNNPVKYTDPDGKFIITALILFTLGQKHETAANLFISLIVFPIAKIFSFKHTFELFTKSRSGDKTEYKQGPDSAIAKAIGADKTFNARISNDVNADFSQGSGGEANAEINWSKLDLDLSIGGLDGGYSWTVDSYNKETGIANITVTVKDTFDFNVGERPPLLEKLTAIGRKAKLAGYDVEITTQMQVKINNTQGLNE